MDYTAPGIAGWKKILIAFLIAADLALLVAGVLIIPPKLSGAASPDTPPKISEAAKSETPPKLAEAVNPDTTPESSPPSSAESSGSDINPTAPPDDPVETTPTATTEPEVINDPSPEALPEVADLSTEERPDLGDFLWYTESVFYEGPPTEAAPIEQFDAVTGGWKALILYDPENTVGSSAMEFLNIDISGAQGSVKLTLDWYLIFWSDAGESIDETGDEDTIFTGAWENGSLWASGAGTIRLSDFYTMNGSQYAIGTLDASDGTPAYIALVRP